MTNDSIKIENIIVDFNAYKIFKIGNPYDDNAIVMFEPDTALSDSAFIRKRFYHKPRLDGYSLVQMLNDYNTAPPSGAYLTETFIGLVHAYESFYLVLPAKFENIGDELKRMARIIPFSYLKKNFKTIPCQDFFNNNVFPYKNNIIVISKP